jgi:predicted NAD-dependent protein-ADP-ribosyltransferase YbiA (DUF1768 family)
VVDGNLAKFAHNPDLGAFLAATQPRVLVEASPRDRSYRVPYLSQQSPIVIRDP